MSKNKQNNRHKNQLAKIEREKALQAKLYAERVQLSQAILRLWGWGTDVREMSAQQFYTFVKKYSQLHVSQAVTALIKQYGMTDKAQISEIKAYFKQQKEEIAVQRGVIKEQKEKEKVLREAEKVKQAQMREVRQAWEKELIISTQMPIQLQISKTEYVKWREMGRIPVSKVVTFRKWGRELETAFHHPSDIQHINSTLIAQWRAEDKESKKEGRLQKQAETEWLKPLKLKVRRLKASFLSQMKEKTNVRVVTQGHYIHFDIINQTHITYLLKEDRYMLPISVSEHVGILADKWDVQSEKDVNTFEQEVHKLMSKIDQFSLQFENRMKEVNTLFQQELNHQINTHSFEDNDTLMLISYIEKMSRNLQYKQIVTTVCQHVRQAMIRLQEYKRDIQIQKQLENYTDSFFIAKSLQRQFKIYMGPTNSGKTYEGIQALIQAKSGVYLAPLRLLALEVYEKLNAEGVPCNLITGEQRIMVPHAKHTASTIECLDFMTPVDVAVIDEVQMYADEQRGWAWTNAILGCPANEVYIAGMKVTEKYITQLLNQYGLEYEVYHTERFSELLAETQPVTHFGQLKNGDALIAFSKNEVLAYYIALKDKYCVSVIYGAMPPEQRARQAEQFRQQVNEVGKPAILVATDAIGMGLNLPIHRVIFTAMTKWNGKEIIALPIDQVLQIAGRAGRRIGVTGKEGYVAGVNSGMVHKLKECIHHTSQEQLQQHFRKDSFFVMPTQQQVMTLAKLLKTDKVSVIFKYFQNNVVLSSHLLKKADLSEKIRIAKQLESSGGIQLLDLLKFVMTPVSKDYEFSYLSKIYHLWKKKSKIRIENTGSQDLEYLEKASSKLTIYSTLAHHYPDIFIDIHEVDRVRQELSVRIAKALKQHKGVLVAKQLGHCEYVKQYRDEWDEFYDYR